jgi:hypothetical protein
MEADDPSIAKMPVNGQLEAVSPGETYIWLSNPSASSVKVPGVLKVTVAEDRIVSLAWEVTSISLKEGQSVGVKVFGTFQSGAVRDVTSLVGASVDDASIATVSRSLVVKGVSAGTTLLAISEIPYDEIRLPKPMTIKVAR